jgi:hypothetical protein
MVVDGWFVKASDVSDWAFIQQTKKNIKEREREKQERKQQELKKQEQEYKRTRKINK